MCLLCGKGIYRDFKRIGRAEKRTGRELVKVKKCNVCGKKGLEVVEICPDCLQKAAVDPKYIEKLKQISGILGITADTDGNIKDCMQSIIEIAEDLENGKI